MKLYDGPKPREFFSDIWPFEIVIIDQNKKSKILIKRTSLGNWFLKRAAYTFSSSLRGFFFSIKETSLFNSEKVHSKGPYTLKMLALFRIRAVWYTWGCTACSLDDGSTTGCAPGPQCLRRDGEEKSFQIKYLKLKFSLERISHLNTVQNSAPSHLTSTLRGSLISIHFK